MLTKDTILTRVARRTQTVASEIFGGDLCIREHTRAEFRAIRAAADRGKDEDGNAVINTDYWSGGLFANAVIDAATGLPLFTLEDVLAFPHRAPLWNEIARVADLSVDLSEVGHEALKAPSSD